MTQQKNKIIVLSFLFCSLAFFVSPANGQKQVKNYDAVVYHLKTKYQAKKVKIPFMWLARFAVGVVRPAGVKSFSVTVFENLKFSKATFDGEMQAAMRNSMSAEWSPILRVRSRTGEQVYMYLSEAGKKNVKIMLVTIDKTEAVVIRAKFSPEKLADFVDNPKMFGISFSDDNQTNDKTATDSVKENVSERKDE